MACLPNEKAREVPRTPVSVNGVEVPYAEIAREVQFHPATSPIAAWQSASRALAVRALMLQEAERLGLGPHPLTHDDGLRECDDEALLRQLLEKEVSVPAPEEEHCRRYFERNRSRFRSPEIVEANHILLAASKDDAVVYADRRTEAERVLEILKNSPEMFEQIAREISDCPSADQGGNLGQLSCGQTTPEFEAALQTMMPGEISPAPVETRYGFHIIQLIRRVEGGDLPFEAARPRIEDYLRERVERMATAQYLARLVSKADVSGVSMPEAQDLRVF